MTREQRHGGITVEPNAQDTEARIQRIGRDLRSGPIIPAVGDRIRSLQESLDYYRTPGLSVAVMNNGEIEWARGYGVLEAGTDQRVTRDTIFQACSISKHVAMVGALRLVQHGALDLDENANHYLTSWKLPANGKWEPRISLRQLLAHTAGLTQNGYLGFRRGDPVPTLLQVLDGEPPANTPPVRSVLIPGAEFRYSGSHYSVLQQLMIDVTGQSFPELMNDLVLHPLGMAHSSYDQRYAEASGCSVAVGHYLDGVPVVGKWRVIPEMAAAGLWTTPEDLAQLAIALQDAHTGQVTAFLPKELVDEALAAHVAASYGLGVGFEGTGRSFRFGHGGSNVGYRCISTAYAEFGKGAVVMTNSDDGIDVAHELLFSIAREYDWPDYYPNRTPAMADSRGHDAYAGTYELRPAFVLTVRQQRQSLVLEVPGQPPIPLRPSSETTFFAEVVDAEIDFVRDDGEMVTGLVLRQEGREFRATKRS